MRKSVVWSIFGVCALAGFLALGWLSIESIRLDEARDQALEETERARVAELEANLQIDLQDRVGRAVWLLDSMLTPLIALEATRPADVYRSFVEREVAVPTAKGRGKAVEEPVSESVIVPSPLLNAHSEFVRLHFQIDSANCWTSPQVPGTTELDEAAEQGLAPNDFVMSCTSLDTLSQRLDFRTLCQRLPQERIGNYKSWNTAMNAFDYNGDNRAEPMGKAYAYGRDSIEQWERQNKSNPVQQMELQAQQAATPQLRRGGPSQTDWQAPPAQTAINDLSQRNRVLENFANSAFVNQQLGLKGLMPLDGDSSLGVTRPLWLDNKLLLARQAMLESGEVVVQGCWLDWERLQDRMAFDVAELLPEVEFEPVYEETSIEPNQLLATLPVQLIVPPPTALEQEQLAEEGSGRPIMGTLSLAWVGFLFAVLAGGGLLFNAELLSERRAQFVSSVTHELRTPLTTFRMYTEMLSSGMVKEPDVQREYLVTLQTEADRLTHLVENVLAYSRLEHGKKQTERVEIELDDLVGRIGTTLQRRVEQMGQGLKIECGCPNGILLTTDLMAVEQILANLVDNACKYGASTGGESFILEVHCDDSNAIFRVKDHGVGVPAHKRQAIFYPFRKSDVEAAKTAPGIGLGLALSRRLAIDLGGSLTLDDQWKQGACFEFRHPITGRSK